MEHGQYTEILERVRKNLEQEDRKVREDINLLENMRRFKKENNKFIGKKG